MSDKKEYAIKIINTLENEYPQAQIRLDYKTPFELLVAVVLSAQCTDERVNRITKELFKKYTSINDFAYAVQEELESDIYSAGYFRAKAKNIIGAAKKLMNDFQGIMPNNMEELLSLPGVGRKSANVILGHCFGIPGIVVDTHVIRLANLFGWVETKNPEKIEKELCEIVPIDKWILFTHLIISHGRAVCIARRPRCQDCKINKYCNFFLLKK